MRLASFVISFCLHAGFVLLVLFWPAPPPYTRAPQPMTVSLVDGLPGGNRTPAPILGPREAPAQTQAPPAAPPKEAPPPVASAPTPTAAPAPMETALLPKLEAPDPVRRPPPEKEEKPAAPKEADKKPEVRKPEAPKDPVKEALDRARASASPAPGVAKVKPNAVAQALAAARKQSGGGGGGEGEGGGGIGDVYAAQIVMAVQPNWHWPAQAQGSLSVALYLKIDATGRVLAVRVEESSGNSIFDSSAVSAVRVTQVLPPPPSPAYREIILRFFPMQ